MSIERITEIQEKIFELFKDVEDSADHYILGETRNFYKRRTSIGSAEKLLTIVNKIVILSKEKYGLIERMGLKHDTVCPRQPEVTDPDFEEKFYKGALE